MEHAQYSLMREEILFHRKSVKLYLIGLLILEELYEMDLCLLHHLDVE